MLHRLYTLAFLSCLLLLSACSDPRLSNLNADSVILAFGDSLTQGVGTKQETSYPSVLAELTDMTVINAGISGETTYDGLDRFSDTLDEHDPDLVILLEGGNDILRNMKLADTKANLSQMIEIAKARNIQLVLIGVPRKNLFSDSATFYQQLADEHALAFDGEIIAKLLRQQKYKSDPIHFNEAGYRKLAEAIHQLLKDNGAL